MLREKIHQLRGEGYSYNAISKLLRCSKSTINYHLVLGAKQKIIARNKRYKWKKKIDEYNLGLRERYEWKYDYLLDRQCVVCGESNPLALQFDHKSKYIKTDNMANLFRNKVTIKELEKEAKKCRVLCANCHQIKTAKETNRMFYQICMERKIEDFINECGR